MRIYKCTTCTAQYGGPLVDCPRCRKGKALVMALNECEGCTTLFAVGLRACPNCRSKDFHEEGSVPKITVHGGATNSFDAAISPAAPEVEPLVSSVPDQGPTPVDPDDVGDAPVVDDVQTEKQSNEPEAETKDEEKADSGEELTLSELRKECEKLGLPTYGNKAALKMRLNGPAE